MWMCRSRSLNYDIIKVSSLFNETGLEEMGRRVDGAIKIRENPEKYKWHEKKEYFMMSPCKLNWNTFFL